MSEPPQRLLEIWRTPDGRTSLILAGPPGDAARQLNEPGSELVGHVRGASHFEAMTRYYQFVNEHLGMKWGEYSTIHDEYHEPYPSEWFEE